MSSGSGSPFPLKSQNQLVIAEELPTPENSVGLPKHTGVGGGGNVNAATTCIVSE